MPDGSFYAQKPSGRRPSKKARKSGSGRKRARTKYLVGPRLPGGGYYSAAGRPSGRRRKGSAKRSSRKGKRVVTSKSGRTYKKTPTGNWSLVRGKKSRKGRKGGKRRGRR